MLQCIWARPQRRAAIDNVLFVYKENTVVSHISPDAGPTAGGFAPDEIDPTPLVGVVVW